MLDDRGEVAGRVVEQLGEVVLDLDIVIGARETEARRPFEGQAGRLIQLADECFEIQSHIVPLTESESCRQDPCPEARF